MAFDCSSSKIIIHKQSLIYDNYLELSYVDSQKFIKEWECLSLTFPVFHKIPIPGVKYSGNVKEKEGRYATIPLIDCWFKSPSKKLVAGTKFVPYPKDHPAYNTFLKPDVLNIYTGFIYQKGQYEQWWSRAERQAEMFRMVNRIGRQIRPEVEDKLWNQFKEARQCVIRYLLHKCYVWCRGYEDRILYLLCWMAKKIQHPYWKPSTAIVLSGKEGAGKTTHANEFGALFGDHYLQFANIENNLKAFARPDQEV